MLTGRPAFSRETVSDIIAAILEREPDWNALPEATPSTIRRLLERCLEKDPKRRLHDIADARIEIDDALGDQVSGSVSRSRSSPSTTAAPDLDHVRRRRLWITATLALVGLVVAVAFTLGYWRRPVVTDALQFVVLPPEGAAFGKTDWAAWPSRGSRANGHMGRTRGGQRCGESILD